MLTLANYNYKEDSLEKIREITKDELESLNNGDTVLVDIKGFATQDVSGVSGLCSALYLKEQLPKFEKKQAEKAAKKAERDAKKAAEKAIIDEAKEALSNLRTIGAAEKMSFSAQKFVSSVSSQLKNGKKMTVSQAETILKINKEQR